MTTRLLTPSKIKSINFEADWHKTPFIKGISRPILGWIICEFFIWRYQKKRYELGCIIFKMICLERKADRWKLGYLCFMKYFGFIKFFAVSLVNSRINIVLILFEPFNHDIKIRFLIELTQRNQKRLLNNRFTIWRCVQKCIYFLLHLLSLINQ